MTAESPKPDLTVIILALNEEKSIGHSIGSVRAWAQDVIVLDSGSTDSTVKLSESLGATVHAHPFESFAAQRNWALDSLPITTDWVLFLDADEVVPAATRAHITDALRHSGATFNAFYTPIRMMFLGRELRHGDLYRSLIRLFRRGCGRYVSTGGFREKLVVRGLIGRLQCGLVHDDNKGIAEWIRDQLPRIAVDAKDRTTRETLQGNVTEFSDDATMEGGSSARLRKWVQSSLPGPVRPFLQFSYRYLIRLGFLDGWRGFIFHFLLQFWYPIMVEAVVLEMRIRGAIEARPGVEKSAEPHR